ncbi:FAD-dependent oxidoreductase [Geitlerinema sp. PCC 7407]|uniref:FAD-dependent oxidoreductase n=1 Tax=Geitlerinema sp. PCC 7407 TaxID=1173025 RepID=UPI00029FA1B4|nr:FAD-dependent oxidoreductase [Geitlerinema sp. PCC 7407]AFY65788.1 FAD dependent oxidoreductase [Geitlerinema sp. PCC 7407]
MSGLSGKPVSYWIDSTPETDYPGLMGDIEVDVAVVGGGIVGITAALLLKRAGKKVALIEADQIVQGTTGYTTAKLTSLHRLVYADLVQQLGEDKARLYGESNQAAIAFVADLVAQEQIDCDFSRQSAYTFATTEKDLKQVRSEVEAAQKLGLPADFVTETSLPFPVLGAVRFADQAQFHVRKYLLHLAAQIPGDGSHVFEQTRAVSLEGENPCSVVTDRGTVRAQDVILATHLPFRDEGLYFAKSFPRRSYLVGAPIDPAIAPQGMFIGAGEDYHSIRTTPHEGGTLLIVGGEGHKTGEKEDTETCYRRLEDYMRQQFGVEPTYRWSTQDIVSFDKLPYIGRLTPLHQHVYVATGFSLWGMSKGTLSAMILSDLILGRPNPWASLYDSLRATPFVSKKSIQENIDVAAHWIGDRFKGLTDHSLQDLQPGEGRLVTIDGDRIAASRDEQGNLHTVSPICPHLACLVSWNNAEQSWDCPCHGSRFSCDGKILEGPAVEGLAPKSVEVKA